MTVALPRIPFLGQQGCNGLAYNIAPADNHAMFPAGRYIVSFDQFDDAGRCGRLKTGQANQQTTGIHRMESVNVLGRINGFDDLCFGNMGRQAEAVQ